LGLGRSAYLVSSFIRIERTGTVNAYGNVAIRDWNSSDRLQVTARLPRAPDLRARVLMQCRVIKSVVIVVRCIQRTSLGETSVTIFSKSSRSAPCLVDIFISLNIRAL